MFLRDTPHAGRRLLPSEPAPAADDEVSRLGLSAIAGVYSEWRPLAASAQIGGRVEVGSAAHRLAAWAAARLGSPRRLGAGSYFELLLSFGIGWRYVEAAWS